MKKLLTIITFYVANFAVGQINYQTITPKEIEGLIEHGVRVTKRADQRRQLFDEVIASERQDLLAACFAYMGMGSEIREKVAKLPHNTYRMRAAITMLRTSSGYWPEDGTATLTLGGYDFASEKHLLVEPFTSVMTELLPEVKFEVPFVRFQADRAKLADRLEAALHKKVPAVLPPPEVSPIPSETPEVKPVPIMPPVVPKAPPTPLPHTATIPLAEARAEQDVPLLWIGAGVAAVLLLVWFAKSRRA